MRTKTVTRHYCDHCSKGMFKRLSMAAHEAVCYRNPKRQCHRCGNGLEYAISKERLKAILEDGEKCETKGSECPDCLMAAMIQHNTKPLNAWRDGEAWIEYYNKERFQADRREWDDEHKDTHWRYM